MAYGGELTDQDMAYIRPLLAAEVTSFIHSPVVILRFLEILANSFPNGLAQSGRRSESGVDLPQRRGYLVRILLNGMW